MEKKDNITRILVAGFLIVIILQLVSMVTQYETMRMYRGIPREENSSEQTGEVSIRDEIACLLPGFVRHFNEKTGKADRCVPKGYVGI